MIPGSESRVAFVTGAGSGIGRAAAVLFASEGYRVAALDIDAASSRQTAGTIEGQGGSALALQADVRSVSQVQDAVSRAAKAFGRLDVLCNNAGIECYRRADEYTVEEFSAIVETNLHGPFFCAKYAYPHLRAQHGAIVNVSSVQALANESRIAAYAATKAALLALTRGMAVDFAPAGVRVNAVCPGATRTGMFEDAMQACEDPGRERAALERAVPLGRIAEPEQIARAILFLASPQADYVTGSTLVVDGGVLSRLALD